MTVASTIPQTREIARRRVCLFGIDIDAVRMEQAVAQLLIWINHRDGTCRHVVTPNVDHVVLYQESEELRQAYAGAGLVLADGAPVVAASRLLGRPLPERVAGSDLVPCLFHEAAWQRMPLRVYLLGGAPGVGQRAAERITAGWPGIKVVGLASPPLGFEHDAVLNADLVANINACEPDLLLIGLGAPKQELWIHRHYQELSVPAASARRSTFSPGIGRARRVGCGARAWSGSIGCSANLGVSPIVTPATPGGFRNSSGARCWKHIDSSLSETHGSRP
jgi:N-acetylglucosaminyldiphosphoundecaprenol N-acetyl-beta-D-mannosaminyltransferase